MTKHPDNLSPKNISRYIPKIAVDYCHICGSRSQTSIEIHYPDINQTKLARKLSRQIQGNPRSVFVDKESMVENDETATETTTLSSKCINFVRICRTCLKHCLTTIYNEEEKRQDVKRKW